MILRKFYFYGNVVDLITYLRVVDNDCDCRIESCELSTF